MRIAIAISLLLMHSICSSQIIRGNGNYRPLTVAAPTSVAFITSSPVSGTRHDFNGCVGFRFTVGASNITVTDLGRWVINGVGGVPDNTGVHTVKIVDASGAIVGGGSTWVSINTSGQPSGFSYNSVTPVVLTAGVTYTILSEEADPGDWWYEVGSVTPVSSDATVEGGSYQIACIGAPALVFAGVESYVTVNFKYYL